MPNEPVANGCALAFVPQTCSHALLPVSLLRCRRCARQPVKIGSRDRVLYLCRPRCRRRPLDAYLLTDAVGRAVLRHTSTGLSRHASAPPPPDAVIARVEQVLQRVTVGETEEDFRLVWSLGPVPDIVAGLPLADLTERVRQLIDRGQLAAAADVLHTALSPVITSTTAPDNDRAQAAHLLAQLLVQTGQPNLGLRFADYARRAHRFLHGDDADATLSATHLLATAHRHAGNVEDAYRIFRRLTAELTALDGRDALRTLRAQANLAVVLHAKGQCTRAHTMLVDAVTTLQRAHPDETRVAGRMLAHLTAMQHACGQPAVPQDQKTNGVLNGAGRQALVPTITGHTCRSRR
ncbi:tetratricopeptide repeat protein [Micromonospora sp. WMMD1102]|uniref:tetratricopeptide repeat protein n=1 Tax=Micromonospora sp. WMMD1102 TaxID=3016105 RepID=UPI002414ED4B|nr:tetratricopeptide repeat protein [Micromonospora sp. WMMD1102]MDG4784992.1 tetratricopeptide repeat protein [Micromonospora sp. WMMD1102]